MAAMTTALTEFSTIGDSRTYTTSGHTTSKPKLVVQRRRVPVGNQTVAEVSINVVHASTNANSEILPNKVSLGATCKLPIEAQASDIAAALVIFRDMVASDEFSNAIDTLEFLA